MLDAALAIGGLGLLAGLGLSVASKLFYVYVDPKILEVEEALPGANCGGCGSAGCSSAAVAMVSGTLAPNACVGGGPNVAKAVAAILGLEVSAKEPEIAVPGCKYGLDRADLRFKYSGVTDCRAAILMGGGAKECTIGCLGLGTCARECPFGAITMSESGLPVVNLDLCTGCGTCERVCPKHIIKLSSGSRRLKHLYQTDECTAPCQRTCPAEIRIPDYIQAIAQGDYRKAVEIIKYNNPFPLVCGRICPHPCEYQCRRGLADQPISINHLKRFAAEYEMNSGERIVPAGLPSTDKRVAVIGGGAEGLSAAYFLTRLGHSATVYEAQPQLGGLLRTVIADYRLPMDVLDWEIEGILQSGVTAKTGVKMGRDFDLPDLLREGYDTVVLAAGGWDSLMLREKTHLEEIVPGNMLLMPLTMALAAGSLDIPTGSKVAIVGDSRASLNMAVMLAQDGKNQITMICRKTEEELASLGFDLAGATSAGVRFEFAGVPTGLIGEGDALTGLEIMRIRPADEGTSPDTRPRLKARSERVIETNRIITAIARYPELIFVRTDAPEKADGETEEKPSDRPIKWRTIDAYKTASPQGQIGMFDTGATVSDYKSLVEAIGAGRKLARSVDRYLKGLPVEWPELAIKPSSCLQNIQQLQDVLPAPRKRLPDLGAEEDGFSFTHEDLKLTQEMAKEEAKLCLNCGLICYERSRDENEMEAA
ncbi:MAG: FAD-dependent oxidoreductase [Deltaproteobacteria bacterium]|nr:FAD-dependent oxidoreductase [Deltaproteobacteria bacterium]